MRLFKKNEKHPFIRIFKKLLGIHIDRNKVYAENRNHDLSFKFRPKLYKGDVLLISAQNKKRPCIYEDLCNQQERSESIIKWRNNISGKLYTHEIPGDHNDIMNEPGVSSIAQIINKHLLKE